MQPVSANAPVTDAGSIRTSRYFYDEADRRVLSQEGVADQADLSTGTHRAMFEAQTHRRAGEAQSKIDYNKSGQPVQTGQRRFKWDAVGRLSQVDEVNTSGTDRAVATYSYNHRRQRNRSQSDA